MSRHHRSTMVESRPSARSYCVRIRVDGSAERASRFLLRPHAEDDVDDMLDLAESASAELVGNLDRPVGRLLDLDGEAGRCELDEAEPVLIRP